MARFACLALVLSSVLFLGGCLESDEHVTLKKDGSGTIVATYVTDKAKLKVLLDTYKMMSPPQESDAEMAEGADALHPAWFKEAAKSAEGFTIDSSEYKDEDETRTTVIKASFTSLAEAAKGGAFFNATVKLEKIDWPPKKAAEDEEKKEAGKDEEGSGGDGEAGAEQPKKAWRLEIKPIVAGQVMGMPVRDAVTMFQPQLDSLKLERHITLPTEILSTTGTKSEDGKTVTQKIAYEDVTSGKSLDLEVVFADAEGLELEPVTFTPDLMALVPRATKAPPEEKEAAPTTPDIEPGEGDGDGEKKDTEEKGDG